MILFWHKYKYFPYEKELAIREVESLFPGVSYSEQKDGLYLDLIQTPENISKLYRLVYFSAFGDNLQTSETLQNKLENSNGKLFNRQVTRYSTHGIHEYKGKFNPQIVRVLLNIFSPSPDAKVLDPFCGSGTTLLECTHLGIKSLGIDINPLAVFIANTKQKAVKIDVALLKKYLEQLENDIIKSQFSISDSTPRLLYLKQWFPKQQLGELEKLRNILTTYPSEIRDFFLVTASNLLRDYSYQDPVDLRIRRRKTPLPEIPFWEQFKSKAFEYIKSIEGVQEVLHLNAQYGTAVCDDIKNVSPDADCNFDFAITSPPYATALPYIDTQRLSLVWLDMIQPDQIMPLDMSLIGSREIRNKQLVEGNSVLLANKRGLATKQFQFCMALKNALKETDGFRRQAVPYLLYRYFSDMQDMFISVRSLLKFNAIYVLVVGSNHTTLGGTKISIETPKHLADIASECGWSVEEIKELQTYQRYGYNIKNATTAESLIVLRAK